MNPTETPHPLAVEAARKLVEKLELIHKDSKFQSVWIINQMHAGPYTGPTYENELAELKKALTFHTTALEPVIQAANELARFVRHNPLCAFSISGGKNPCNCGLDPAADKWLTLTSPKTGCSDSQEGPKDAQEGFGERFGP